MKIVRIVIYFFLFPLWIHPFSVDSNGGGPTPDKGTVKAGEPTSVGGAVATSSESLTELESSKKSFLAEVKEIAVKSGSATAPLLTKMKATLERTIPLATSYSVLFALQSAANRIENVTRGGNTWNAENWLKKNKDYVKNSVTSGKTFLVKSIKEIAQAIAHEKPKCILFFSHHDQDSKDTTNGRIKKITTIMENHQALLKKNGCIGISMDTTAHNTLMKRIGMEDESKNHPALILIEKPLALIDTTMTYKARMVAGGNVRVNKNDKEYAEYVTAQLKTMLTGGGAANDSSAIVIKAKNMAEAEKAVQAKNPSSVLLFSYRPNAQKDTGTDKGAGKKNRIDKVYEVITNNRTFLSEKNVMVISLDTGQESAIMTRIGQEDPAKNHPALYKVSSKIFLDKTAKETAQVVAVASDCVQKEGNEYATYVEEQLKKLFTSNNGSSNEGSSNSSSSNSSLSITKAKNFDEAATAVNEGVKNKKTAVLFFSYRASSSKDTAAGTSWKSRIEKVYKVIENNKDTIEKSNMMVVSLDTESQKDLMDRIEQNDAGKNHPALYIVDPKIFSDKTFKKQAVLVATGDDCVEKTDATYSSFVTDKIKTLAPSLKDNNTGGGTLSFITKAKNFDEAVSAVNEGVKNKKTAVLFFSYRASASKDTAAGTSWKSRIEKVYKVIENNKDTIEKSNMMVVSLDTESQKDLMDRIEQNDAGKNHPALYIVDPKIFSDKTFKKQAVLIATGDDAVDKTDAAYASFVADNIKVKVAAFVLKMISSGTGISSSGNSSSGNSSSGNSTSDTIFSPKDMSEAVTIIKNHASSKAVLLFSYHQNATVDNASGRISDIQGVLGRLQSPLKTNNSIAISLNTETGEGATLMKTIGQSNEDKNHPALYLIDKRMIYDQFAGFGMFKPSLKNTVVIAEQSDITQRSLSSYSDYVMNRTVSALSAF